MAGSLRDFLAPHIGQLIDALAEFGRVGVLRDEIVDEGIDLLIQLGSLSVIKRDKTRRLVGRDRRHRIGRRQVERVGCRRGGRGAGHNVSFKLLYVTITVVLQCGIWSCVPADANAALALAATRHFL